MRNVALVERSLRSALTQKIQPEKVLFIDQNVEPLKLADDIVSHPLFHHERFVTTSLSKARNHFILKQNTEWIVLCDDDGYMDKKYSEVLQEILEKKKDVEIIAGAIVREDNHQFYTPRHELSLDLNKFQNTKLLMGSNFAIRRDTFEKIGKYDEDLGVGSKWGSAEETDLAWKGFFMKVPMHYDKNLVVFHPKPYQGDFKSSFYKAYRYGLGKGAMVAKWLFKYKKVWPIYELIEMSLVPLLKFSYNLLRLRGDLALIALASLYGRYIGLVKYLLQG